MADIYRTLQKHLDKQAVGFPATRSGAEIRILERLFTPEEAKMALHLTYHPVSIVDVHEKTKAEDISLEDLESILNNMAIKGAIGKIVKNNTDYYHTIPFAVGMLEYQVNRLSPEFVDDTVDLIASRNTGLALLSTKVPQMRTIPVEESIKVEHHVTTYDNLRELIEGTEGPISVQECLCRQSASIRGYPCKKTSRLEICMAFGDMARVFLEAGTARQITKGEAIEIQRQNQAEGLVLQPSNDQKIDFICVLKQSRRCRKPGHRQNQRNQRSIRKCRNFEWNEPF